MASDDGAPDLDQATSSSQNEALQRKLQIEMSDKRFGEKSTSSIRANAILCIDIMNHASKSEPYELPAGSCQNFPIENRQDR